MSVNDQISDILSRLTNAILRKKEEIVVPYTKMGEAVAEVLVSEKYLTAVEQRTEVPRVSRVPQAGVVGKKVLALKLNYTDGVPAISGVRRISKPGVRIYTETDRIPLVLGGKGTVVLSTSAGVMSGKEAKKRGLGGEVICKVW